MWQLIFGYVIIRMEGYGLERMLNRMNKAGIRVYSVRRESAYCIRAKILKKHFFKLRALKRGMYCRIRIEQRQGLPFTLAKLRHKKVLISSSLISFALIVLASARIFFISVEGANSVPESLILRALEAQGVGVLTPREDIAPIALGNAIREFDSRIAWAGVSVEGITLKVQVKEAQEPPPVIDKSIPSDVVATKDAIIKSVTALSGKASVKEGDAVRAGDVLIRGDITKEDASEKVLVYAEGEVKAIVYYSHTLVMPLTQRSMVRTGRFEGIKELSLAGYSIYQSEIPYTAYDLEYESQSLVNGLMLPLRVLSGKVYEKELRTVQVSYDDQLSTALYQAEYMALEKVPKDAQILDKSITGPDNDGESLRVTVLIRAIEQIGIVRAIE